MLFQLLLTLRCNDLRLKIHFWLLHFKRMKFHCWFHSIGLKLEILHHLQNQEALLLGQEFHYLLKWSFQIDFWNVLKWAQHLKKKMNPRQSWHTRQTKIKIKEVIHLLQLTTQNPTVKDQDKRSCAIGRSPLPSTCSYQPMVFSLLSLFCFQVLLGKPVDY